MWTRIICGTIAVLFLASVVLLSVYAILQLGSDGDQVADDEPTYLADFEPLSEPLSELGVEDLVKGVDNPELGLLAVAPGDTLTVNYQGATAGDGLIFEDESEYTFGLAGEIDIFQENLLGMTNGGKRRLLIPATLVDQSPLKGGGPVDKDLVYDIELISVADRPRPVAVCSQTTASLVIEDLPTQAVSQLCYEDLVLGDGQATVAGDTIRADYTGVLAADPSQVFDSQTATFSLEGVIEGWQRGLVGLAVGGQRRLFIPAAQAYGENPPAGSDIPPNADLIFDVELLEIVGQE